MFQTSTRRKVLPLSSKAITGGDTLTWEVPKTGLLAGIYLNITGTLAGTLSGLNAMGKASIVKNVRVSVNAGIDLVNLTGPEYHYLVRNFINDYRDPLPSTDARSVVAAAAYDVSMWLPITINPRDPIGLIMLQNEETLVTITVEIEADANIATGVTGNTGAVVPYVEIFTVPVNRENWPPLNLVHQMLGDARVVAGAGDVEYRLPRGNTYVAIYHGAGMAQSGADAWSRARLVINQSETLEDYAVNPFDNLYTMVHGVARLAGTLGFDFLGSSGLGSFGLARDLINSEAVTEFSSIITFTGASTLYTVRRQLVSLGA